MKPAWAEALPWDDIEMAAGPKGLDPNLVAAIIQHESLGVPFKTRYETSATKYLQSADAFAGNLGISVATEQVAQMHSYGLMQIMGWLARSMGFKDYCVKLCGIPINLEYGCRHLRGLFQRFQTEADVISVYNFGHLAKTPGGMYLNQAGYVDPVSKLLRELRAIEI